MRKFIFTKVDVQLVFRGYFCNLRRELGISGQSFIYFSIESFFVAYFLCPKL